MAGILAFSTRASEDTDAWSVFTDHASVCQLAIVLVHCYAFAMATQEERRAATQAKVIEAALRLFGEAGFDTVTVDDIAATAGVAKGAVYHHFKSKEALFEAVFERASADLAGQIRRSARPADPLAALIEGARLYFEACAAPPFRTILLRDGPAVLGWEHWREIDARYFLSMLPATLERAMDDGLVPRQSTEPLARLLAGAVTEAAVACAAAEDPAETGRAYVRALERLVNGLRA
jgi:AcrR family transcriptional regulator